MRAQDYFDTYDYTYDNNGNILSASQNGTVIKNYGYNYANWKDLLTQYNGQTITYDTIGNPLQYRDGMNFTWANGRQLVTVTNGANNYSYTYNADGLRTAKTVNGVTTNYYWSNGILQAQKTGDEYLIFLYDENGSAYGFLLKNGTTEEKYYYIFNAQGDVIGIVDSNGTQVVNYTYGAWGDILSVTGTLASTIGQLNPIRYRGYYYDVETGFYYLQTRYYDPETGRFLNADGYISTGQGVLSNNMFAYCGNNPVNNSDATGTFYERNAGGFGGGGGSAQLIAQTFSEALIQSEIQKIVAALVGITLAAPVVGNVMEYTTASLQQDMFYIRSRERAQAKEKEITNTPPSAATVIYRYGGTNPGNLTPSQRDVDLYPITGKGLSFSTVPKPGAAMTTIEALNATGVVYAVCDGVGHVSVHPIGGTLEDWHNAGSSSVWTTAVKSVVVKWDGGN